MPPPRRCAIKSYCHIRVRCYAQRKQLVHHYTSYFERRRTMTASSVARAGQAAAPGPRGRRWTVLVLLAVAQLMLILDVTVVNVALPDIGVALRLSRDGLPWVMTAYTLCFGGLMLLGGRLPDRFGPRRLTLAGL